MEKELINVTFTFKDGSQRILLGDELVQWEVICLMQSDYLLPGGPDHVLATGHGGLVRGFVPPGALNKEDSIWKKK